MIPLLTVEITSPLGEVLDVTDRIDRDGVNSISEEVAEDLIQIVHSDMDLELRDADGVVESFFAGAAPDDLYEIRVTRDTLKRRPKSITLFGGVLELPWSLRPASRRHQLAPHRRGAGNREHRQLFAGNGHGELDHLLHDKGADRSHALPQAEGARLPGG